MSLIDERGRLFGKVNIVDAALLLVFLLAIPLSYGAFLLFRQPLPSLVAIEPAQVEQGSSQVNVRGEHLRPSLRLVVGSYGARLLLGDRENGVMELPPLLPPGTYDVVLLDEDQEVDRLTDALIVFVPPEPERPITQLVAVGTFDVPDPERAQALWKTLQAAGQDSARSWDVLDVSAPEPGVVTLPALGGIPLDSEEYQVRAVLRFRCMLEQLECKVFNVALTRGAVIPVPVNEGGESATLRITDLHPVYTSVVDVTLRATSCGSDRGFPSSGYLSALREGARTRTRGSIEASFAPSIQSLDVRDDPSDNVLGEPVVTVHLQVPVVDTSAGLIHGASPLRIGDGFRVTHRLSLLCGRILDIGSPTSLVSR